MTSEKVTAGLVVCQSPDNLLTGFSSLQNILEDDVTMLGNSLARIFDICKVWKIDNGSDIEVYSRELAECSPDLLFVILQSREAGSIWPTLLKACGNYPIVAWSYLPWRRIPRPLSSLELCRSIGASAMFESFGLLQDQKRPVLHAFGAHDDPALREKFVSVGEAARVVRELKKARFGVVLDKPCEGDLTELGPKCIQFSGKDLLKEIDAIADSDVDVYIGELQSKARVGSVSKKAIELSARFSMGLQRIAEKHCLDLLGIEENPGRLIRAGIRARPSLIMESSAAGQTIIQPSQDLVAGLANFILARLSKEPPFFVSLWVWDQARNTVVCGHPGAQPISLAQTGTLSIESDLEWDGYSPNSSAQMQFVAHPGRVTLFQMRKTLEGWLAIAASGMCLESDSVVQGLPHAVIRLDCHIDRFLGELARIGANNHWIMAYASVIPELQNLCEMLGVHLEILR